MHRIELATAAGPRSALVWDIAPAGAPWLHFAHATGMHSGLYARLLAPLADHFHIVASDSRGHGHSPGGPVGDHVRWDDVAADLVAVTDAVAPAAPWLLAGHSMGGAVSLLAAAAHSDRVAGLVLVDPPFVPFAIARAAGDAIVANPMADQAAKRRADFPDVATARAAYAGRGVFRSWSDADLDAYLADGLRPTADGVTLACAPAWEAATFRGVSHGIEAALAALDRPFALIAGETGSTVPPAEFAIFAAHPRCRSAERLAGTTHFVPLERGDAVRAAILAVAG
ncbi:alpha/beta fold hydrolase [Polymorphobacter fuscus]|uniref:Alpha/beta fold hydrolase n=1 Tax=Sandarakinorhabdus fusca TaxID=1439888 RepID=A0A7C9KXG9_9SPHN|nr:alpha/beta fold hydrolase [Polymorphobacter fuscus]KAB7645443.1 alpha/beta hydrolase [Polymorphobacter fuscus]MQT17865.1 alpha/beta fold hydrolase [Polymorphobacter fuscus]NJC08494.1 pimeloyl-ACP methyl ester carboxylesterase [Polymorphobacter fuscus]